MNFDISTANEPAVDPKAVGCNADLNNSFYDVCPSTQGAYCLVDYVKIDCPA